VSDSDLAPAGSATSPPGGAAGYEVPAVATDLGRLPPWARRIVEWLMARWAGRFVWRTAAECARIELFDRSMAIAAQLFTSVFPILIVLGNWLNLDARAVASALAIPDETRSVLEAAIGNEAHAATFGVAGTLIVVISATSLSRALNRAYAAIWHLPRPRTRLKFAWRWAAAVAAVAISLVVVRWMVDAAGHLPRQEVWQLAVAAAVDVGVGLFLPWVLLAGVIRVRLLVPGAVTYAVLMAPVRAATHLWFPRALDASASQYGAIGVAFTYIAFLYVAAWCFLAANVIGTVLVTDQSAFGRWIRGGGHPATLSSASAVGPT